MSANDAQRRSRIATAERLHAMAESAVADARTRLMEADRNWRRLGDRALLDSAQREMNTCMNLLAMRERELRHARSN